jgi:LCP family protein required for cell wall assembly
MRRDQSTVSRLRRAGLVGLIVVVGWAGWTGFKVWRAWDNVDRVPFNVEGAREILAAGAGSTTTTNPADSGTENSTPTTTIITDPPPTLDRGVLNTFLVIGTDQRDGLGTSIRADVILLIMLPPSTNDAIMLSIPRDLYVTNPCLNRKTKINANLNGCGDEISGPELMAIAVEDFTGVPVDHFAVFNFAGFEQIIDTVGGVEICVGDYPIRDLNEGLYDFSMPAGCSVANGRLALSWVRSRHTQQLIDGRWRTIPGVSDLTRNERQQDLLLIALEKLKGVTDFNALSSLVERVADAFAIDDTLGLRDAIGILWDARSIDSDFIYRPVLDVRFSETEDGESILVAVRSFQAILSETYPNAGLWYETSG